MKQGGQKNGGSRGALRLRNKRKDCGAFFNSATDLLLSQAHIPREDQVSGLCQKTIPAEIVSRRGQRGRKLLRFLQRLFRRSAHTEFDEATAQSPPPMDGAALADAYLKGIEVLSGEEGRASEIPAWALVLRSPFRFSETATSWLGGLPKAPDGFSWPRHANGAPLHFLAQIDLASLTPEPTTGARPSGLPMSGAILLFGCPTPAIYVYESSEISTASTVAPPDDLRSLREQGFWIDSKTFKYWPVDPVVYLDADGQKPDIFAEPLDDPADWIVNWGIAALEAEILINAMKAEVGGMAHRRKLKKFKDLGGVAGAANEPVRKLVYRHELVAKHAPEFMSELEAWHKTAKSNQPTDPIDQNALQKIVAKRRSLTSKAGGYSLEVKSPQDLWDRIVRDHRKLTEFGDVSGVPSAYRPIVDAVITEWRGHKLFGRMMYPVDGHRIWDIGPDKSLGIDDFEPRVEPADLRGYDCLLNIHSDPLVGTASDYETDLSIWCLRDRMANGQFRHGQFLRPNTG